MSGIFDKKILLGILPYWDPLIPPSGIATLKAFLTRNGFNNVKNIDLIVYKVFQDLYNLYFKNLENYIPKSKRGNFYNMGHNVLQDHMMAHINSDDDQEYSEFIKLLIHSQFFIEVDSNCINKLNSIVAKIFIELENEFLKILESENPDVFGLSVYKGTLPASLFVFRLAKKLRPNLLTVMGGSVFSTTLTVGSPNYNLIIEETERYIDKIVIGEGEILFNKLLQGLLPDNQRIFSIKNSSLKGLDFKDAPLPDYSDFEMMKYPYIAATGSTSCPYSCSFCNSKIYWGKYKKKNCAQTVDEMIELYKKYNNQLFYLSDPLINPIITDLANNFITREISLYYDCFMRADEDTCNIENTLLWRKGGLYRVRIGVESGSQKILDLINKKNTVERTKASISALAYAGIKTTTYWVIGHPGENEEDFKMSLDMLLELQNDIFQAEPTPLEFVYSGQSSTDEWKNKRKLALPEDLSKKLLLSCNYVIDSEPDREEVIDRINRFNNLCIKNKIPNPYSLPEHYVADIRWKKLHNNSVPPLIKLYNREYIDENKEIKLLSHAIVNRNKSHEFNF